MIYIYLIVTSFFKSIFLAFYTLIKLPRYLIILPKKIIKLILINYKFFFDFLIHKKIITSSHFAYIYFMVFKKSPYWFQKIINRLFSSYILKNKLTGSNFYLLYHLRDEFIEKYVNYEETLDLYINDNFINSYCYIPVLRGIAIQLFILGEYKSAKFIWHIVEKYRLNELRKKNLHNIEIFNLHWVIAIGHIAHISIHIKNNLLNNKKVKYFFSFPENYKISNNYFFNLFRKQFNIKKISKLSDEIINLCTVDFYSHYDEERQKIMMFDEYGSYVNEMWLKQNKSTPFLKIPKNDINKANNLLKIINNESKLGFVCIHVREEGFHQKWHNKNPGTRNADITSYTKAIDFLIKKGFSVVRMGDISMKKLNNKKCFFDYAHSEYKSEIMDIILLAKCNFYIGTNSGISLIPNIFNKRSFLTNWSPILIPQWFSSDVFIPKKMVKNNKTLSLQKMIKDRSGSYQFISNLEKHKIKVLDNNEDEILDLIKQAYYESVKKKYKYSYINSLSFDKKLEEVIGYKASRIGKKFFLNNNK